MNDTTGLRQKYIVLKRDENGRLVQKATPCFVLSPEKADAYGLASRNALREYARCIASRNMPLSRDLLGWLRVLRERMNHE